MTNSETNYSAVINRRFGSLSKNRSYGSQPVITQTEPVLPSFRCPCNIFPTEMSNRTGEYDKSWPCPVWVEANNQELSTTLIIKISISCVTSLWNSAIRTICVKHDLLENIPRWSFETFDWRDERDWSITRLAIPVKPRSLAYFIVNVWCKVSSVVT